MTQFPDEQSATDEFKRQPDEFRDWVTRDGEFAEEPGRYHLYVSLACPWAHRTMIVRQLLGLEEVISLSVVDPVRDEKGWRFTEGSGRFEDPVNGFAFLSEAYVATNPNFKGRFTVPVLWDRKTSRIVNNSEDDICRMFAEIFARPDSVELFPSDVAEEQAELSELIYETVNNGVYQAGFATRQEVYEQAAEGVFATLDQLEKRLAHQRFLFGQEFVETDWRLFCTLIRFDAVYHGHFKCNRRRIVDYPHLSGYLRDLYQWPGIAATVNFDHIKRHYYVTHDKVNPTRIVPIGPDFSQLSLPPEREDLGLVSERR